VWQAGQEVRKSCGSATDNSSIIPAEQKDDILKPNERTGNVYENKGQMWKTRERSWNVVENKGTYPLIPGILLKTKGLFHNLGPA
jgi:hypothetical protein